MSHALAFLFGLALGVFVGLHLVYTQEPEPLGDRVLGDGPMAWREDGAPVRWHRARVPGHSWAPPRYGLVDSEYGVTGV